MANLTWPRRTVMLIATTVLITLAVILLAADLIGGEKRIRQQIERLYSLDDGRFTHGLGVLLGPPFLQGNRLQVLLNGDQIFPPMLVAIRSAQKSITFETYIYWSGGIGHEFAQALAKRARQGVKVHLLLDWVGSAPQWTGNGQNPQHWRDTHVQVEGPVVAQMQAVFLDNWIKVTGVVLHGSDYFPLLVAAGNSNAQIFSSSPRGGSESMQLMYLLAITSASHSIDLSAAYFVPDELFVEALLEAMHRGVKLRIEVPGEHIDSETVRSASRATWGPLLSAGALIAEYQPTMYHCKVMIVNDLLVPLGSTNFDNRSFRLNDEAALNVMDAKLARPQRAVFEADLALSIPISYTQWKDRPSSEKVGEFFSPLIKSQL
jgi:cardiolipin synthase A/B